MEFINVLEVLMPEQKEETLIKIEELLIEKEDEFIYELMGDKIFVHSPNFLNKTEIWFRDYMSAGAFIKEKLISMRVFTEENYKWFFKITRKEFWTNSLDDLDEKIAEVPKDDQKLNDILNKLNKIKKG